MIYLNKLKQAFHFLLLISVFISATAYGNSVISLYQYNPNQKQFIIVSNPSSLDVKGKHLALTIHGFQDSPQAFNTLAEHLLSKYACDQLKTSPCYDMVLGIDYPSDGTILQTIGMQMSSLIQPLLKQATSTDIYAHSMGVLIARYELENPNLSENIAPYIQHAILIGGPNNGIPFYVRNDVPDWLKPIWNNLISDDIIKSIVGAYNQQIIQMLSYGVIPQVSDSAVPKDSDYVDPFLYKLNSEPKDAPYASKLKYYSIASNLNHTEDSGALWANAIYSCYAPAVNVLSSFANIVSCVNSCRNPQNQQNKDCRNTPNDGLIAVYSANSYILAYKSVFWKTYYNNPKTPSNVVINNVPHANLPQSALVISQINKWMDQKTW